MIQVRVMFRNGLSLTVSLTWEDLEAMLSTLSVLKTGQAGWATPRLTHRSGLFIDLSEVIAVCRVEDGDPAAREGS